MTYYVSTSGNDSNAGTQTAPFLTLNKAESVVAPGDIVIVAAGTYAPVLMTRSGISGAVIEFRASGTVTITASGALSAGIELIANYRTITGFTVIQNAITGYGIKVGKEAAGQATANNNILDNVTVKGTATGTIHGVLIGQGCSNNILRNSNITGTYYGLVDKVATNTQAYGNKFACPYACVYAKGSTGGQYNDNIYDNSAGGYGFLMAPSDGGSPAVTGAVSKNNTFIKSTADPAIYNGNGNLTSFVSDYNTFLYTVGTLVYNSVGPSYNTLATWQTTGKDLHSTDKPQTMPNTYYIATNGNDSNPGTLALPFKTIEKISSLALAAGDIVFIRAGTYLSTAPATASACTRINAKNGTASAPIVIAAYPSDFPSGGRVVYDCTNVSRSVNCYGINIVNCSWINIAGIYTKGVTQTPGTAGTGTICGSFWSQGSSNNKFINCEGSNTMTGFRLDDGTDTSYINCDAHDCDDPFTGPPTGPHNNADGFGRTASGNAATNTYYSGCRSWNNADDGWDCISTSGRITYDHCWSFRNGFSAAGVSLGDGNGFKMGGTDSAAGLTRFANNCISSGNKLNGFDQNNGKFTAQFYNNTSYNNGQNDWKFGYNPPIAHQFRNNLSYKNKIIDGNTSDAAAWSPNDHNSWNGITVADSDFLSLDESQLLRPRKPDGALPDITFLMPTGTKLVDKGIDVGLPYSGFAPDIGAIESGSVTPVTYKNVAVSKAFTKNNCTSGSGSSVIYAVPAGKYTSTISQAAADQLATDDINNNGQNYANLNGTCSARTIIKVTIFYSDGTSTTIT